jgi:hypothetical protein
MAPYPTLALAACNTLDLPAPAFHDIGVAFTIELGGCGIHRDEMQMRSSITNSIAKRAAPAAVHVRLAMVTRRSSKVDHELTQQAISNSEQPLISLLYSRAPVPSGLCIVSHASAWGIGIINTLADPGFQKEWQQVQPA